MVNSRGRAIKLFTFGNYPIILTLGQALRFHFEILSVSSQGKNDFRSFVSFDEILPMGSFPAILPKEEMFGKDIVGTKFSFA